MLKFCNIGWVLSIMLASRVLAVEVTDDDGNSVRLDHTPVQIVSLAPHATEMLFAIGVGNRISGAVDYSDYPQAARTIPRVGGYSRLDVERIVALKPDLVVAWLDGNGKATIERLKQLGLTVYVTEPVEVLDVAANMERLSVLTGSRQQGIQAARQFRQQYHLIKQQYANRKKVSVFYQLWHKPLMTATSEHLIGKVIGLCGGRNIFAGLPATTPKIGLESVLAADPQAIIASGHDKARPEWLDGWRRWPQLQAVKNNHLFFVPPDILQRHSPRILLGARQVCQVLEQVRQVQ